MCFVVSIVFIGVVTAVIGDLASLLGCVLGWEDSIVAITLVALGTSLPDTFASKTAAVSDSRADAAVGNVTGSNAVNVFLGLGISWVLGAFYWWSSGANQAWLDTYGDGSKHAELYKGLGVMKVGDPLPGLAVPAGSLGFSVGVFTSCAIACIISLTLRRAAFGAELGGQLRWPTFAFFVGLWVLYIALSVMDVVDII